VSSLRSEDRLKRLALNPGLHRDDDVEYLALVLGAVWDLLSGWFGASDDDLIAVLSAPTNQPGPALHGFTAASGATDDVRDRAEREHLALAADAMWSLGAHHFGIEIDALTARIDEIDATSGFLDGRRPIERTRCADCESVIPPGRATCLFCGSARASHDPFAPLRSNAAGPDVVHQPTNPTPTSEARRNDMVQIALLIDAIWATVGPALGLDGNALAAAMDEIDASDGARDGVRARRVVRCASCDAAIPPSRSTCAYCGKSNPQRDPFSSDH